MASVGSAVKGISSGLSAEGFASDADAQAAIQKHANTWWFIAVIVAGSLDALLDLVNWVPIFGWVLIVLSAPLTLYMYLFNMRHGNMASKIASSALITIDAIPVVSIFMLGNFFAVAVTYAASKRRAQKAREYLKKSARRRRQNMIAQQQEEIVYETQAVSQDAANEPFYEQKDAA